MENSVTMVLCGVVTDSQRILCVSVCAVKYFFAAQEHSTQCPSARILFQTSREIFTYGQGFFEFRHFFIGSYLETTQKKIQLRFCCDFLLYLCKSLIIKVCDSVGTLTQDLQNRNLTFYTTELRSQKNPLFY